MREVVLKDKILISSGLFDFSYVCLYVAAWNSWLLPDFICNLADKHLQLHNHTCDSEFSLSTACVHVIKPHHVKLKEIERRLDDISYQTPQMI